MKNLLIKVSRPILALIVILSFSQCEEENSGKEATLLLQVIDEWIVEPVGGVEVTIHRMLDDWAYEKNPIKKLQTNAKGEVMLEPMPTGEYFFNVVKGTMNNWHYPGGIFINEGETKNFTIYISDNINGTISSVNGKRWALTGVTNELGEDLSYDPVYTCLLDNVVMFMKSGYYSMEEGSSKCDATGTGLQEGSWWSNVNYYLSILIADGGNSFDFFINDLTDNSFSATQYLVSNPVTLHYELIQ